MRVPFRMSGLRRRVNDEAASILALSLRATV